MARDVRAKGFGRRSAGEAERQATPVTAQKERGAAYATAAADLRKKQSVTATVPAVGSKEKLPRRSAEHSGTLPSRAVDGAEEGILEAALEIAQRHEEILSRLRIAVRKGNTKEILQVARELVALD